MNNDVYLAVFTDHDDDLYIYVIGKTEFSQLNDSSAECEQSDVPGYKDCYDTVKDVVNDVIKNNHYVADEYQGYMY